MRRLPTAIALLALLAPPLAAQSAVDIPYERFVLPNGLTVLVHEDHKAPIVAVNVWYHVGSKNERPGRTGFAHLFEHLMFNGSEHYDKEFQDPLERAGATDMNGTTNEDRTNYFANVPTSALDLALWLESDRMGHLLGALTQAKLDEQRGVVQNEKRQGENEPYGKVWDFLTPRLYPANHPYSWTVIGSMEDLDAAKLDDVKAWFQSYYGPANAVLVVAGDIDVATAKAKVGALFRRHPVGPAGGAAGDLDRQAHRQPARRHAGSRPAGPALQGVERARVGIGRRRLPGPRGVRAQHRQVLPAVQAAGLRRADRHRRGRLGRPARDRRALHHRGGRPPGRRSGPGRAGDRRGAGPPARRRPHGGGAAARQDADACRVHSRRGADRRVRREVRRAGEGRSVRGAAGLLQDAARADRRAPPRRRSAARRRGGSRTACTRSRCGPSPSTPWRPPGPTGPRCRSPARRPDAKFPALERDTLSNGLKIVLAERRSIPLVRFDLLLDAGFAADQFAQPGTASLAMSMLDEGTATRTALQISDRLADLGATLGAASRLDVSSVSLETLREQLDPALALYADVILHPAFPKADFERLRKQRLVQIQREKADPIGMALRVLPRVIYGDGHAYANPWTGSGTEASTAKITRESLVEFHRTWFKPNHATLVVVGATTMAEIKPRLERLFAAWRPGDVPREEHRRRHAVGPAAGLPARQAGLGADGDHRRQPGPAQVQSRRARDRDDERGARQRLQLAPQHEPARGQALVLRRLQLHPRRPRASGRSSPTRRCRPTRPRSRSSSCRRSCARS